MESFSTLLDQPGVDLATLTKHLGKLSPDQRRYEATEVNKAQQVALCEAAGRSPHPISLDYLLPANAKPYVPYPFDGRNSLPIFTRFQKVFYKMDDGRIGGFNNQNLGWFTGPGYYVAEMVEGHPGEIGVNYMKIPGTKPQGWPPIKPNEAFPSRFIYANMIDYLRWVSDDVVIGRAYRAGTKPMPNWFLLSRTDRMT